MTLDDLISRYPTRWQQAKDNPALRGWFVNKMTDRGASMADRVLARKEIDQRATEQIGDGKQNAPEPT